MDYEETNDLIEIKLASAFRIFAEEILSQDSMVASAAFETAKWYEERG